MIFKEIIGTIVVIWLIFIITRALIVIEKAFKRDFDIK